MATEKVISGDYCMTLEINLLVQEEVRGEFLTAIMEALDGKEKVEKITSLIDVMTVCIRDNVREEPILYRTIA